MLMDSTKPLTLRVWCVVGMLLTLDVLYLGIWPSPLTVLAVLVMPACVMFLIGVLNPSLITKRSGIRHYLNISLVAAGTLVSALLVRKLLNAL
jgi:hypothetical protein